MISSCTHRLNQNYINDKYDCMGPINVLFLNNVAYADTYYRGV